MLSAQEVCGIVGTIGGICPYSVQKYFSFYIST